MKNKQKNYNKNRMVTVASGRADAHGGAGGAGGERPLRGGPLRQGHEQLLQQAPHRPRRLRQHLHRLCCVRLHSGER